jgi:hypothetical protein
LTEPQYEKAGRARETKLTEMKLQFILNPVPIPTLEVIPTAIPNESENEVHVRSAGDIPEPISTPRVALARLRQEPAVDIVQMSPIIPKLTLPSRPGRTAKPIAERVG